MDLCVCVHYACMITSSINTYCLCFHKEIQPVHPKGDQSWVFIGRTDAEDETPIFWPPDAKSWLTGKDPYAGKIEAGEEGDNRGWDGWMASLTQWTWVWASSGSWWWTGRPGVLRSVGLQRFRHDWVTELNWTESTKIVSVPHAQLDVLTSVCAVK